MKNARALILENKKAASDIYRMRVESAYLGRKSRPGQFVEVRCSEGGNPLLRRPLGIHRISKGGIELLYEVVGKGTELLARKERGETLDVIGPIGNGFDIKSTVPSGPIGPKGRRHSQQSTVLVAGGIGVAPMLALADSIVHSPQPTVHSKERKVYALIGAKTKNHILCENEFKKAGAKVMVATEDGSSGKKGFITGCLETLLSTRDCRLWTIYACGPTPMLKAVAAIADAHRIYCQVSLEERMACGVGVCLGCPVKVKTLYAVRSTQYEYKMVCKDGPVFNAEEIAW